MKKQRNGACLSAMLLCTAALLCLISCGQRPAAEPVTLTLWHVYGGEVDSPLNPMIEQFNDTVGREKGIAVKVTGVTNSAAIHNNVLAAAYEEPGAPELPDMFVSYPKTVLALPDENILVDYRDYFTDEEIDGYFPEFIEEGTVNGRLAVLPVTKSTEVLFVNKTAFDRFAADTGASLDDLATYEGLFRTGEMYREWSGGKCFFVCDSHFNYFQVGVESLGESFFAENGAAFGPAFERVWGPYARAALRGELWLGSGYATEPLRTGDAVASVASSASVLYYSDVVTYPDNTSEQIEMIALPCPIFEGGEKLVIQRGVGMCTVKSTPERENACMTFLKWLNEPERNVELTTAMGYMPVTRQGFDKYLPDAVGTLEDPMYASLYETFMKTRKEYRFYVPPQREDYLDLETRLEKIVRLKLTAGQTQLREQGEESIDSLTRAALLAFRESYEK